jgi:hypothetical protein
MNLIAKPIIKGEYWVVTDGDKKVGNVIQEGSEYKVKINNKIELYDSTKAIEKLKHIEFEKLAKVKPKDNNPPFAVFPTDRTKIYNSVLDVKRKLHLYTTAPKSKCYFVAGWFAIKTGAEYVTTFCPKYIFVQRYEYLGPFATEAEANSSINTL